MPHHLAVAAALALALLLPPAVVAQSASPSQAQAVVTPSAFVADLVAHAVTVLKDGDPSPPARQARFRALIDDKFDLSAIAQTVMGRHWRRATAAEQAQFPGVFADYLVATYAPKLADYGRVEFTVVGQRAEDVDTTLVSTWAAQGEGAKQVVIDWRVMKQAAGQRITDVIISGISLMQTKRAEIAALIDKSDGHIAGLIADLQTRTAAAP